MSQIHLSFLPLLFSFFFSFFILQTCSSTIPERFGSADFVKSSCRATEYPDLCFQSLSIYRNQIQHSPKQLAQTALLVSLTNAKSARNYVTMIMKGKGMKSRDYKAVKDCVYNMGDSVDQLRKSITEFGYMGRVRNEESFIWHMSNVQTWVSAALTDENTCMDGFSGYASDPNLKASIKSRVVKVAQVTSNALALINRFAKKHY